MSPDAHNSLPSSHTSSWTNTSFHQQTQTISVSSKTSSTDHIYASTETFIANGITVMQDPYQELKEAFQRFDVNCDGKISATELGSVLRSLGDNPSDEELFLMVKEVDRDGDGFINLEEFVFLNSSFSSSSSSVESDQGLRDAFQVFDADSDGKISAQELHRVLIRLGDVCTIEDCGRMIRGVDTDGDGYVDFQEFCRMMSFH